MGSGDVILCADHPILGQAVIVLPLDYPNCYESQDAFSSGHVECTSLPHRSDVFKCLPHFMNIGILALSIHALVFWPHPFKHWSSRSIFINTGIPAPSVKTLVFWPHPFKHWNLGLVLSNIGIPALFL